MRKKILIVEDDAPLRESLKAYLASEGFEITEADCCSSAKRNLNSDVDLIILDWMLGDGQGIELLRQWRSENIKIPMLFLTARVEIIDRVIGLELGADDYITKPFDLRELLARLHVQLRKSTHATLSDWTSYGAISVSASARQAKYHNQPVELTKTEFELLRFFMENPGRVYTRDELLNSVWGYDHFPTTRTVDTHVMQLRQKFGVSSFLTVHGVGYRFQPEEKFLQNSDDFRTTELRSCERLSARLSQRRKNEKVDF